MYIFLNFRRPAIKKVFSFLFLVPVISIAQNYEEIIPLWGNGAPDFEELRQEEEEVEDHWVKNIHNSTLTAYFSASGKSYGTAVLIFSGGGHRLLVIDAEGAYAQEHLNKFGITAFVLKYRLAREPDSLYEVGVHAKEDAQRSTRLIRKNAGKWGLDKEKIGIMGFSARGEVANWRAYDDGTEVMNAALSPFNVLKAYCDANTPIEAHFYSKGGYGFNMGYRSDLKTIRHGPARLED